MPPEHAHRRMARGAAARRPLLACLLLGCSLLAGIAPAAAQTLIKVDAAQRVALGVRLAPVRRAADAALDLPARVVVPVNAQALVAAPVAGRIERVEVGAGEPVRRGEELARMRSVDVARLQRERDDARVQLQLARQQAQRDRQLLAEGVIAAARAQASATQQRQAASLLRERELALRMHGAAPGADGSVRLLAPIDGVVAEARAVPGERVDAMAPLFRLVVADALALEIDATAAQAAALRAGAAVDVPAAGARGVLLAMTPGLSAGQSVVLRARLQATGSLRAGALVRVRVHLPAQAGLFVVPPAALTRMGGHDAVLVADPEGFRVLQLRVVARLPDAVVVDGALREGQQVAASGVVALKAAAGAQP